MSHPPPPFRADHVGSFLRPKNLAEARAKFAKKEISAAQLREIEDAEIKKVIAKQEEVGLKLATDGEFRRAWWHFDFLGMLEGVDIVDIDHGIQFKGVTTKPRAVQVTGRIGFSDHPMIEHFKFLKANTRVTPKMTIPAPSVMHFRMEPDAIKTGLYKHRDDIFADLAAA
jgi:5-methyltetrahydropteroyltriglutamate--homocysteine methyltransferase